MRKIEVDGANLSFSIFFHSSSVQSGNNLILFDITSFGQKKTQKVFLLKSTKDENLNYMDLTKKTFQKLTNGFCPLNGQSFSQKKTLAERGGILPPPP